MNEIAVQMTSNSTASRLNKATRFDNVQCMCNHNGGETVIITVDDKHIVALRAALDDSNSVRSYEVLELTAGP